MVIKTNNWRPDTCWCKVSFIYDNQVPREQRIHTFKRVLSICVQHTGVWSSDAESGGAGQALFVTLLEENRRKNGAIEIIEKLSPHPSPNNGENGPDLLEHVYWDFNPQRVLLLTLPARITPPTMATALEQVNAKFGAGKVEFIGTLGNAQ